MCIALKLVQCLRPKCHSISKFLHSYGHLTLSPNKCRFVRMQHTCECACTRARTCNLARACLYTHTDRCTHRCMFVCVHTHARMCKRTHTHTRTHTRTHTHTQTCNNHRILLLHMHMLPRVLTLNFIEPADALKWAEHQRKHRYTSLIARAPSMASASNLAQPVTGASRAGLYTSRR